MTHDYDNANAENAQGKPEEEPQDLTLEVASFLECLSSIVLRQLHTESPAESEMSAHEAGKAA